MLMVNLVVLTLDLVLVEGTSVKMDFLSAGLVRSSISPN